MINNHSAVLKESKYVEKIPFLRCKNAKSLTKRIRANIKAKNRGTKGYKSMSIDKLLSMLDKSEPVKKLKLCKIWEKLILIKYTETQETFFCEKKTKTLKVVY